MTWELVFANLAATWAQTALTMAAGSMVLALARGVNARMRLLCAQALLVASILAPFVEPRQLAGEGRVAVEQVAAFAAARPAQQAPARPLPWRQTLVWIVAGGALLRLAWLGAGYRRLARYARSSEPWHDAAELDAVMRRVTVTADVGVSPEVSSPVTFGFLAPVVLVPPSFGALPAEAREAVLLHELLHIRRRDWGFVVAEEVVRALLWFQPAVWWLLGQVHLYREQVVDDEVVRRTGRRSEYVEALIAVARTRMQADLAPAPLFLKRRHLASRVDWLVRETNLPWSRAAASMVLLAAAVIGVGWYAVQAFPIQTLPAATADGTGGVPQADVSGEKALPPPSRRVDEPQTTATTPERAPSVARPPRTRQAAISSPREPGDRPLSGGVPGGVVGGVPRGVPGGVAGTLPPIPDTAPPAAVGERSSLSSTPPEPPKQIRIGGNVMQSKLVKQVAPLYPPLAKQARVQGTVRMTVLIDADGAVGRVQVENGHPLLVPAAVEAVRQWRYQRTLLNGEPVEVVSIVDVNFTLSGTPAATPDGGQIR